MFKYLSPISYFLVFLYANTSCLGQSTIDKKNVERIIRVLSSDSLQGRAVFTPGIDKAASFIKEEFSKVKLSTLTGAENYEDQFKGYEVQAVSTSIKLNGKAVEEDKFIVDSYEEAIAWSRQTAKVEKVSANGSLSAAYGTLKKGGNSAVILVNPAHKAMFERLKNYVKGNRMSLENKSKGSIVLILSEDSTVADLSVNVTQKLQEKIARNIVGIIPGKSKKDEYVIFSGHYDHIGIQKAVNGDSIANGADDDASGTTAVITLANYFKKLGQNERTLIFVAFTAEEVGCFGSKNFARLISPEKVVAMFNIEMIGKESKFGPNSAFITGFEKSDFGKILQKNTAGTKFAFHPDPYPDQNLFYRSDNATLAKLGVPAHTISTDQIDKDPYYHTVEDEFETLNVQNLVNTIEAIIKGSETIINGKDTPSRISER